MLFPQRSRTILLDPKPQISGFEESFEVIFEKNATEGIEEAIKKIQEWYSHK